jgi:hypothetical protein
MGKTVPSTAATSAAAQRTTPTPQREVEKPLQEARDNSLRPLPSPVDLPVWACVR